MTRKQQALEKTGKIWDWLAKHPRQEKGGAYSALRLASDISNCPCCQYVKDVTHRFPECSGHIAPAQSEHLMRCPLVSLWPKGCCHPGSPFIRWNAGKAVAANARRIANAAKAELLELAKRKDRDWP